MSTPDPDSSTPSLPGSLPVDPKKQLEVREQLRRWVARRFGPEVGPTDVAGGVLVKALERRRDGKSTRGMFRWARNRAIDTLRKLQSGAKAASSRPAPEDAPGVGREVETVEAIGILKDILKTLPPDKQALFDMWFVQKLTLRQIAEVVGKNVGAVKVELHRLRSHVAELMRQKGWEWGDR
ncbi:RNA polymerase sigma factor [Zavarzinella formosa]|uniref:RNA polymerase sigma factor n=1 Tax=Zavarzinella formosa TaxID=360055 RepID=UPI00037A3B2E|nr:sigma-70 family RNA polymerase sigma factor [Zavarzinella formosa]